MKYVMTARAKGRWCITQNIERLDVCMFLGGVLQGMYAVNELQISYRNFSAMSACTHQGFVDFHAIWDKFKDKKRQIYATYCTLCCVFYCSCWGN